MRIAYLDGARLRRSLLAASEHVQHSRAELNRINVFPVPDGDTGTNLALTVRSISERMRDLDDRSVAVVAREAADAGIMGARGNCGMILSHFLLGFSQAVAGRTRLTVAEFARALRSAAEHVHAALERPVEGTILTVMREVADRADRVRTDDFVELIEALLEQARDALARTPELLPKLKEAGVVDAGAKGFVHLLEGVVALVEGDPIVAATEAHVPAAPMAAADAELGAELERFRFCTEALVRQRTRVGAPAGQGTEQAAGAPAAGPVALPDGETVRARLRALGDSLIVIRSGDLLKVHVHTDEPERVFEYLRGVGDMVSHKAEDMRLQHAAVERAAQSHVNLARRPLVVLADSGLDLPAEIVNAHGIQVVPLLLVYDEGVLRDRVDITPAEFTRRLLEGDHPTTSQPTPAAFLQAMKAAAVDGEQVVGVILSGALSGTLSSAEAAARRMEGVPVHLIDSRAASLLQGLLALKAAEMAEGGAAPDEIRREIGRVRDRSHLFFTVDTFDRLLASGRVGRGRALLGELLDIKPILALDRDGRVEPVSRVRGRDKVLPEVMRLLEENVPPDSARSVRFGIAHVACEEVLEPVAAALRSAYGDDIDILTAPATPVLATHIGPGAWGLACMVED